MKQTIFLILIVAVVSIFSSCIPSLHPLYTEETKIAKPEILGEWLDLEDPDSSATWSFVQDGEKTYELKIDQGDMQDFYEINMVEINNTVYMDIYPVDLHEGTLGQHDNSFLNMHLLPVHNFARVKLSENQLELEFFDYELLEKLLEEKKVRIKHEETEAGYVLTAQPEELQLFFEKYVNDDFFDSMVELVRK